MEGPAPASSKLAIPRTLRIVSKEAAPRVSSYNVLRKSPHILLPFVFACADVVRNKPTELHPLRILACVSSLLSHPVPLTLFPGDGPLLRPV